MKKRWISCVLATFLLLALLVGCKKQSTSVPDSSSSSNVSSVAPDASMPQESENTTTSTDSEGATSTQGADMSGGGDDSTSSPIHGGSGRYTVDDNSEQYARDE